MISLYRRYFLAVLAAIPFLMSPAPTAAALLPHENEPSEPSQAITTTGQSQPTMLQAQAATLLRLARERLRQLTQDLSKERIDRARYKKETASLLASTFKSAAFLGTYEAKEVRTEMRRLGARADVPPVWVVGDISYRIAPQHGVVLSLVTGDGQVSGTALDLNGAEHPFHNPEGPQEIGRGLDLTGSVLLIVTAVLDINPASNHTSVTYTLRGGVEEKDYPFATDVAGNAGQAFYLITVFFERG